MRSNRYINLANDGCLCKDADIYSIDCCEDNERWGEKMGGKTPLPEPIPEPIPEPDLIDGAP